jgi:hypothetical protein
VPPNIPVEFHVTCDYYFTEVQWFWDGDDIPDLITGQDDELVEIAWPDESVFDLFVYTYEEGGWTEAWVGPIPITISNECVPPTAKIWPDVPWNIKVGMSLTFYVDSTEGSGPLTFQWNWDDGNGYGDPTDGTSITHQFDEIGTFYVRVKANNPCGSDVLDSPIQVTVKEF